MVRNHGQTPPGLHRTGLGSPTCSDPPAPAPANPPRTSRAPGRQLQRLLVPSHSPLFLSERCGWLLTGLGSPWVAQRVWAIPRCTSNSMSRSMSCCSAAKVGEVFSTEGLSPPHSQCGNPTSPPQSTGRQQETESVNPANHQVCFQGILNAGAHKQPACTPHSTKIKKNTLRNNPTLIFLSGVHPGILSPARHCQLQPNQLGSWFHITMVRILLFITNTCL